MECFKKEILQNIILKMLSFKIFEDLSFERKFCKELYKENILKNILFVFDKLFEYKLFVIFWVNKYYLKCLLKKLWDVVERNKCFDYFQFYFVRFGECCGNDENFIICIFFVLDVINLIEKICYFRIFEKEIILYLVVFFEKFDYDVYCFLRIIL